MVAECGDETEADTENDGDGGGDGDERAEHEGGAQYGRVTRHGRAARDDGVTDDYTPLPWLALDYGAFTTDDRDPSLDENAPTGVEEQGPQTEFDPTDADEREAYWKHLDKLRRQSPERRTELHEAGIRRDLDMVCDQLGCTDHQRDRAEWLLTRVDIKGDVIPSGPIEVAVLAAVTLVVDEDRTRFARQGRSVTSVLRDTALDELIDDLNITRTSVRTARHRLRDTDVYESPND